MTRRRSSAPDVPTSTATSAPGRWLPNLAAGVSVWNLEPDLNAPQLMDGRLLEPIIDGPENLPDRVEWDVTDLLPLPEARATHPEQVRRAAQQFDDALGRTRELFADGASFARYREAFTVPPLEGDGEAHYFYGPRCGKLYVMNWGASAAAAGPSADRVVSRLSFSDPGDESGAAPGAGPPNGTPAPETTSGERAADRRHSRRPVPWLVGAALVLAAAGASLLVRQGERVPRPPPPEPTVTASVSTLPPPRAATTSPPRASAAAPLPPRLPRVQFEVDNAELGDAHVPVLEQILNLLTTHPEVRVLLLEGHTDARGVEGGNMVLSMWRALRVRSWLEERGIEPGRLRAVGCGARYPAEGAATPEAMRANRRVEIHVLAPEPDDTPLPRPGCADAPR